MNFTDEALRILARQIGGEGSAPKSREDMEAMLLPMIRVAMRTGLGRPGLVQWVQRTLPAVAPASRRGEKVDPEWAAPRMARLLCSQILQKVRPEPARAAVGETVVGI